VIKVVGLGELQVETVAQFGVVFLLFALGLEFSMSKVQTFHLSLEPQFKNQNFRVLLCAFSVIIVY
jgi:Kef-type K+ transport system membrane component KefB